eukprot:CAMPEP_0198726726 /NCGR_PEP_ID=MMETSP1475-20131203/3687_1 /TAXON_ID= ORGANISM="Unidentified sp., Strain CCMP1999" /NCGR_SAMPLE_ID=MMETSP1475 /ASSEMBLY_ACC=CAM_ASM_001111 /LENGTH=374 /DNA_ID=CAMNT_0044488681 /DNA_START=86 /DNA_END=1210 /DNA_ORIENTATION=+
MASAATLRTKLPVCLLRGPISTLDEYASRPQMATTLRQMYELARGSTTEKLLLGAQFLHAELPVRLAHRAKELENLPYNLNRMPSVVKVRQLYETSFHDIVDFKRPGDEEEEEMFTDLLIKIKSRHNDVNVLLARGVLELKAECGKTAADLKIHSFLDRFYRSRIGIRTLISHQADMRYKREGYVGIINPSCSPAAIAEDAAAAVRNLAYRTYGDCPDVKVYGQTQLTFPYIEGHIFFCIFELLKNSVRATLETHADANELPEVKVVLADGTEDVTIKISDEGGGIPRSEINNIWTYLFTTAELPPERLLELEETRRHGGIGLDPFAGFGYGLPLSRLHARYFRGDLSIVSMEGFGTDAYLHLSKLWNKGENLP